jgi:hypothetical protein
MPFDESLRSLQSTAPWGREVVPSSWQWGGPYIVASDTMGSRKTPRSLTTTPPTGLRGLHVHSP